MDRYIQIYIVRSELDEKTSQGLKNSVRAKVRGLNARITWSSLYSYQGGSHGPLDPASRPADWVGEGRNDEYVAHNGDILILVGAADRYGYAAEKRLIVRQFADIETFLSEWDPANPDGPAGVTGTVGLDGPRATKSWWQKIFSRRR